MDAVAEVLEEVGLLTRFLPSSSFAVIDIATVVKEQFRFSFEELRELPLSSISYLEMLIRTDAWRNKVADSMWEESESGYGSGYDSLDGDCVLVPEIVVGLPPIWAYDLESKCDSGFCEG